MTINPSHFGKSDHNHTENNLMSTVGENNEGMLPYFRSAMLYFSFIAGTLIFGSLVVILTPFFVPFDRSRNSLHKIALLWAQSIVKANFWWKFSVTGTENLPKSGSAAMIVCNHNSNTDILAIYMSGANFRWLSKDSLFKFPILGWAMKSIGYIGVKRGDKNSHLKCLEDSRLKIRQGIPMLFFPEGTRSKDGVMGPFKSGAFKVATEEQAPILPITMIGTENMLPKHSRLPRRAFVTIVIHPQFSTVGMNTDEALMKARSIIASSLPPENRGVQK